MNVLVTGTTGGIGGAVASAFRAAGHTVHEVNRGSFAADRILPDDSPRFAAVVFATGTCPVVPVSATTDDMFMETVRVNCGLFLRLVREIVKRKLYNPEGAKIVAVSSVSATEGWAGGAAYCASKGALSALCRALDAELSPRGISVAALEPRYVATAMFDRCAGRMGVPRSEATPPDVFAAEVLKAIDFEQGTDK
jgi:NAD(P)-dependent dehydrogenase (short-subunit alcohol dehydrogenase family)